MKADDSKAKTPRTLTGRNVRLSNLLIRVLVAMPVNEQNSELFLHFEFRSGENNCVSWPQCCFTQYPHCPHAIAIAHTSMHTVFQNCCLYIINS